MTEPQSLHRYAYTYNNPIIHTDPTGLFLCDSEPGFMPLGLFPANGEYVRFCGEQKGRLEGKFSKYLSGADGLMEMFTDPNLPGGSSRQAQQMDRIVCLKQQNAWILFYGIPVAVSPEILVSYLMTRVLGANSKIAEYGQRDT